MAAHSLTSLRPQQRSGCTGTHAVRTASLLITSSGTLESNVGSGQEDAREGRAPSCLEQPSSKEELFNKGASKKTFYRPWDDGGQSLLDHISDLIEARLRDRSSRAVPVRRRQKRSEHQQPAEVPKSSAACPGTTTHGESVEASANDTRDLTTIPQCYLENSRPLISGNPCLSQTPYYSPFGVYPPAYLPFPAFSTASITSNFDRDFGNMKPWIASYNLSPLAARSMRPNLWPPILPPVPVPVEFVNNGRGIKNPFAPRTDNPRFASSKPSTKNHGARGRTEAASMVKRFLCSICGKGFNDTFDLKRHTRTHTGVRPYKCDHCLKSFTQRCSLETHARKLHGVTLNFGYKERRDKLYVCEDCGDATASIEAHYVHLQRFHSHTSTPSGDGNYSKFRPN